MSEVPLPAAPPKPALAKVGDPAGRANASGSGPLIINVAEALAAAKRSDPDPASREPVPSR